MLVHLVKFFKIIIKMFWLAGFLCFLSLFILEKSLQAMQARAGNLQAMQAGVGNNPIANNPAKDIPPFSYLYTQQMNAVGVSFIRYEPRPNEACVYKHLSKSSLVSNKEEEEISAVLGFDFSLKSCYVAMRSQNMPGDFCIITVSDRIILQRPQKVQTFPLVPLYFDISDFLRYLLTKQKPVVGKVYKGSVVSTDRNNIIDCKARYIEQQTLAVCLQEMPCQVWEVNTSELKNFWAKAYLNSKYGLIGFEMGDFRMTLIPFQYAKEYSTIHNLRQQPMIFNLDHWQKMEVTIEKATTHDFSARAGYNSNSQEEPNNSSQQKPNKSPNNSSPTAAENFPSNIIPNRQFQTLYGTRIVIQNPPQPSAQLTWNQAMLRVPEFLLPTPWLPASHPIVLQQSQNIRAGVNTPTATAERIAQWTYQNLEIKSTPQGQRLAMFLGMPKSLSAVANVTLCRAAGLPARLVAGLEYQTGRFVYTSWAEVYLGAWLPISKGKIGGTGPIFLAMYENTSWAHREPPDVTLTIQNISRDNLTIFVTSKPNYLQKNNIQIQHAGQTHQVVQVTDYLLGISFYVPPNWELLEKEPLAGNLAIRFSQIQGPVILIQIVDVPIPLEEFLQTVGQKLGGQNKFELLWQQARPFAGGKAYQIALKTTDGSLIYRAVVAQVETKIIAGLLVTTDQQFSQVEPGFQIWMQSLSSLGK